jgi:ParB family chromosome partitioning protein
MQLDLSGLDELADGGLFAPASSLCMREIALESIDFDTEQPRRRFDEAGLAELARSIVEVGVLQPVSVRAHPDQAGRYLLNFGERRVRACHIAGRRTVPALVQEQGDAYRQVIENLQREALSPLDLARFVAQREQAGESRAAIARKLGKSRSFVTEIACLAAAPQAVKDLCASGRCTDVRTLYTLARGAAGTLPVAEMIAEADAPVGRQAAQALLAGRGVSAPGPSRRGRGRPAPLDLVVLVDGRTGRLECGRPPDAQSGFVRFETGDVECVALERLRLVAWAERA